MASTIDAVNQRVESEVSEEVTLSRDLKLFTVTMIGVGGMIGAGIFVLTGIAAGVAGPALILAFALNGFVTLLTAMSYAELGSLYPVAGGSYRWVKQGLGGAQGYLAGWLSWFANGVAGSLYALAFGRFASEMWLIAGLPTLGLSVEQMTLGFMTFIIVFFIYVNSRGASETGAIGNIITVAKVVILAIFIGLAFLAMSRTSEWHHRFTTDFMPNGMMGVFMAMGLTFIAFEGYEIIAQSGEEVVNPRRNVPLAIFLSIGIAVVIYILVSIAAIGAITPPEGVPAYEYLGLMGEVAIVEVARQVFPMGTGAIVLLISGLVSTMSALNAVTYSSSRVSFAMWRDHNLPSFFAKIDPVRRTPVLAIAASGGLMIIISWTLPIEDVAAASSIMFLLLFMQVNLAMLVLRRKSQGKQAGFKVPWFPVIPLIAICTNALLAINLLRYSIIAWAAAVAWIIIGMLAYFAYFSKAEAMEKPKEILLEEVLVSRDYSVLVPVSNHEQARILGQIGAILAQANKGEALALHVVQVPPQLSLFEGRLFLKESRPLLETVIEQAKLRDVPVHTIIRLGRNVPEAIRTTAMENASNLLVMGWPGYTKTSGRLFGSVIDPIVDDPPTDIAVVRHRERRELGAILVPVAGGPNSRRAALMATQMAMAEDGGPTKVTLLHVVPAGARNGDLVRAQQVLTYVQEGIDYAHVEQRIVHGSNVVNAILNEAEGYDLIVIGASEEPLFQNLLMGGVAEQVATRAEVTVVMFKRRSSPLHSFLRQTVLEPSTEEPLDAPVAEDDLSTS